MPCAIMIKKSIDDLNGTSYFTESPIAMFSYGAFVAGAAEGEGYTNGTENIDFK